MVGSATTAFTAKPRKLRGEHDDTLPKRSSAAPHDPNLVNASIRHCVAPAVRHSRREPPMGVPARTGTRSCCKRTADPARCVRDSEKSTGQPQIVTSRHYMKSLSKLLLAAAALEVAALVTSALAGNVVLVRM